MPAFYRAKARVFQFLLLTFGLSGILFASSNPDWSERLARSGYYNHHYAVDLAWDQSRYQSVAGRGEFIVAELTLVNTSDVLLRGYCIEIRLGGQRLSDHCPAAPLAVTQSKSIEYFIQDPGSSSREQNLLLASVYFERVSDSIDNDGASTAMVETVRQSVWSIEAVGAPTSVPRGRPFSIPLRITNHGPSDDSALLQTHTDPMWSDIVLDCAPYICAEGLSLRAGETRSLRLDALAPMVEGMTAGFFVVDATHAIAVDQPRHAVEVQVMISSEDMFEDGFEFNAFLRR